MTGSIRLVRGVWLVNAALCAGVGIALVAAPARAGDFLGTAAFGTLRIVGALLVVAGFVFQRAARDPSPTLMTAWLPVTIDFSIVALYVIASENRSLSQRGHQVVEIAAGLALLLGLIPWLALRRGARSSRTS